MIPRGNQIIPGLQESRLVGEDSILDRLGFEAAAAATMTRRAPPRPRGEGGGGGNTGVRRWRRGRDDGDIEGLREVARVCYFSQQRNQIIFPLAKLI